MVSFVSWSTHEYADSTNKLILGQIKCLLLICLINGFISAINLHIIITFMESYPFHGLHSSFTITHYDPSLLKVEHMIYNKNNFKSEEWMKWMVLWNDPLWLGCWLPTLEWLTYNDLKKGYLEWQRLERRISCMTKTWKGDILYVKDLKRGYLVWQRLEKRISCLEWQILEKKKYWMTNTLKGGYLVWQSIGLNPFNTK